MEILAKEQIDTAIIYNGNPCQLAIVHALNIPYIYFDLEGFSLETKVASGTSFKFPITNNECNFEYFFKRYLFAFEWLKEQIAQSGFRLIARMVSNRYLEMDEPITKLFAEDYEIKQKFKNKFLDVNLVEIYF